MLRSFNLVLLLSLLEFGDWAKPVSHKQHLHSVVNRILFVRVLFWRRFWDVNSGRHLSQISATNLRKTWRKPDLHLLPATRSLLSSVSYGKLAIQSLLWLINCPSSHLLFYSDHLSTFLQYLQGVDSFNRNNPFCILEESQISKVMCWRESRLCFDGAEVPQPVDYRWKTQDTTWMLAVQ